MRPDAVRLALKRSHQKHVSLAIARWCRSIRWYRLPYWPLLHQPHADGMRLTSFATDRSDCAIFDLVDAPLATPRGLTRTVVALCGARASTQLPQPYTEQRRRSLFGLVWLRDSLSRNQDIARNYLVVGGSPPARCLLRLASPHLGSHQRLPRCRTASTPEWNGAGNPRNADKFDSTRGARRPLRLGSHIR